MILKLIQIKSRKSCHEKKNGGNESEFYEEDGDGDGNGNGNGDGDGDGVGSDDGEFESDIFENSQSNSNKGSAVPFEPAHGMMEYANYFMQPNNPTGQLLFTSPSIQPNQFVPMSNVIQLPVQSIAKNAKSKKGSQAHQGLETNNDERINPNRGIISFYFILS